MPRIVNSKIAMFTIVSPMATSVYCSTISVMITMSRFSCTPVKLTSWDATAICMNVKFVNVYIQNRVIPFAITGTFATQYCNELFHTSGSSQS